jgi:hypothetical protein
VHDKKISYFDKVTIYIVHNVYMSDIVLITIVKL